MSAVLIVGCGYLGRRVARREREQGNRVVALVRSAESATDLRVRGLEVLRVDLDDARSLAGLPTRNAVIYYFAPPPSSGRSEPRISHFLSAIGTDVLPARFGITVVKEKIFPGAGGLSGENFTIPSIPSKVNEPRFFSESKRNFGIVSVYKQ